MTRTIEKPGLAAILFVIALLILLVQLGQVLFAFAGNASAALGFPYPLDYSEGPQLDQALRLAAGENIYHPDLSNPPFTLTTEPPLYRLLQAPFALLFGPAFWYGRALSLLGALAAALFLGLTLHVLTRDLLAALSAGLLLLAFPYLMHGSALAQPDAPALALSWAGLYVAVRWPDRRRGVWLAAVLFALAVFTRQTYFIAAPLAAVAWLAQQRRFRRALALLGLAAALCLALFLVTQAATGGGLAVHLAADAARPYSVRGVVAYVAQFLPSLFYLFLSTVFFLILEPLGERTESWPLALPYFAGAVLSAFFSGRAGSSAGAFYELSAALALGAGAIFAWSGRNLWLRSLIALVLAAQAGAMLGWARLDYLPRISDRVAQQASIAEVARRVREAGGPVLAGEYLGLLPLAGRRIPYQPVEFKALSEAGLWDETPVVEALRRREFALVLFYVPIDGGRRLTSTWNPAIRNAVWENYREAGRFAFVYLYEPAQ